MPTLLRASDARRVPWKNGRGTTLELASDTPSADEAWTWRLSIADVAESGPFSRFPECERFILCLDGQGMELAAGSSPRVRVPHIGDALRFSGDLQTHGELVGSPVRDANLIVMRARWNATLSRTGSGEVPLERADIALVHVLAGRAVARVGGVELPIDSGETLIVRDENGRLSVDGDVLIARLTAVAHATAAAASRLP
ncbi:MAG: HutD family protein [Phycisphaerae bacterium]|nr:HutD family protein [Phycisphaerae bacterium]